MKFYTVKLDIDKNPYEKESRGYDEKVCPKINEITSIFNEKNSKFGAVNVTVLDEKIRFNVALLDGKINVEKFVQPFIDSLKVEVKTKDVFEIDSCTYLRSLNRSGSNYLVDNDEVIDSLGISPIANCDDRFYSDEIITSIKSKKEIEKDIDDLFLSKEFEQEIERIYSYSKVKDFLGHPCHYFFIDKNNECRRAMNQDLVSALYNRGRLTSTRYTIVNVQGRHFSIELLENLYKMNEGATIVIKIPNIDDKEDDIQTKGVDLKSICKVIKTYCDKTLTIFSFENCPTSFKNKILNSLLGVPIVELTENKYFKETAVQVIQKIAKRKNVALPNEIIEKILNSDRNYDVSDLYDIFNSYKQSYICNEVFPKYKQYMTYESEEKQKEVCDAYKELKEMIGLENVKQIIDKAINFFKLQNEYRKRGIKINRPCMHMVFTGNPGTAKTTVARLIAQILKDNNILTVGKLIEVGRGDLVGQFVGHTAPLVQSAFNKAKGSVLFIDEAYSLVDDRKGSFGDEAINAIVQEMENNRDDVLVILAGYKDEMDEFLDRNPGLNSRIAFHVDFNDYSDNELLDISKLIAKKTGYSIDNNADELLLNVFEEARKDRTFGNGRYARNVIEQAKFNLAERLKEKEVEFISDTELLTLKQEDFMSFKKEEIKKNKIGFGN